MRSESITLAIFEKYSPEDLAEVAQKMAQAQADLENVETEKKVSDAAFNERIKKFEADVSTFAKQYNKGGETAQIGCDIRYDHPEAGKKSYFRMDRNELVETHDMSWEEKQETLQFPLAENPPNDEEGEEVTHLCPYPNCTLFAEHDGDHELRASDNPEQSEPPEAVA